MLIETPERTYRVLRVLKEELSLCMYLAVDAASGRSKEDAPRCLMLEFLNPVLGRQMMLYLTEHKQRCFVRRGVVWAVFPHHEGCSFREAARRADTPEERVKLWDGLLARLFYENIPAYLRYEAAAPGNLVVDEYSVVWVNYELHETDRLQEVLSTKQTGSGGAQGAICSGIHEAEGAQDALFLELQKRLYESFYSLFAGEPVRAGKDRDRNIAAAYGERLREGSFANEAELCREFGRVRAWLTECGAERGIREKGILLRLWETVSGHTDLFLKCGYFAVVLALWALFFFLCLRPAEAPEQRTCITTIGTVEIGGEATEPDK